MCDLFGFPPYANNTQGAAAMGNAYNPDPVDNTPPEVLLAKAFKDDLNVTLNPQALRLFIRWRWERVQKLAHAIHEGK